MGLDMSRGVARAITFVRWWVRIYTAGLSPGLREARRDELESDLWEHVRSGNEGGARSRSLAAQIVARCLLGVPGDLAWRAEAGRVQRRSRATRRGGATMSQRFKRNWWVPAPIALGIWMIVVALAHVLGDGTGSPFLQTPAGWDLGPIGRAATVTALAAMAAACLVAVAVRDRRPGLTVALPVPAALLNLTPLMWNEITLWHLLPVLSIVTLAGTLYNMGRSVGAGRDLPAEGTEIPTEPIAEAGPPAPIVAPGPRSGGRRVVAALAVVASAFALYPVAAGATRMVGGFLADRSAGAERTSVNVGAQEVTGNVGVAGTAVAGLVPTEDPVVIDPITDVTPVTGAEAASAEPGAEDCLGITVANLITAPSVTDRPLPALSPRMEDWVTRYGRNAPGNFSDDFWMNTGGEFGGGIPSEGVRRFLRQGSAAGLSDQELTSIITNQSFMHGANDPNGGARLLEYIGANPDLFSRVADFVAAAPATAGWGAASGQNQLLAAIPELNAAYSAMAGPLHTSGQDYDTVDHLIEMAQQADPWGDLARKRLDEVLTYGPRASSADKGMARYLAATGYAPSAAEAQAGRDFWNAYGARVRQVQSGLTPTELDALPKAPTGAARPMVLTPTNAGPPEQC
jgi:hypothetical protein